MSLGTRPANPLVSIVIPLLNESVNVERLAERIDEIVSATEGYRFELIAVDDGSTDDTPALLEEAAWTVPATVVRLSRNFGSHYAITAGFDEANGDCAIVLGADLQEPVSLVGRFLTEWGTGADVVWGIRASRATNGPRSWPSRAFSWLFTRYASIPNYPAEGPSGVLCDRLVLDAVTRLPERNRNVLGLIAWVGFNQTRVSYDQAPRIGGETKWTSRRLLKLALDSFVQFSAAPLRGAALVGLVFAVLGFLYAVSLVGYVLAGGDPPEGWVTVVILLLVIGGLQLLVLGLLGEYLWRTADEARQRPNYVVRSKLRKGPDGE